MLTISNSLKFLSFGKESTPLLPEQGNSIQIIPFKSIENAVKTTIYNCVVGLSINSCQKQEKKKAKCKQKIIRPAKFCYDFWK